MEPKLAANYMHFTRLTPHEAKIVHRSAIPYGSYRKDTAVLALALIGLALMAAATLWTLAVPSIL
jgi:hypothetical protein